MKICFLALSGYGKSTAIDILKKHYDITNIKIAEPLYKLQHDFYSHIGIEVGDRQDGELLQFYGKKIRKECSHYLIDTFKSKLDKNNSSIITNDDCRPEDYKFLKENDFIFVKINGYRRNRDDITLANLKDRIEWQSEIPFDYEVDNFGSIEEYETKLVELMNKIIVPKCYIIPTQNLCNSNCIFCISKTRNYDKEQEFLKVDNKFLENIYTLKRHGIKRFEITGGGEPFLNNSLESIVLTIKRIIPNSYIKLYTNGNVLKKITGVDEIDISVVSNDNLINNKFMNGNNIELIDKLKFFKEKNVKLRLSIPLIKGAIDSGEKLDNLIKETNDYVDEYVVRTLYPNTKNINELYIDFDYKDEKVVMEKDNDVKEFNGIILWADNNFYNSWNLDNKKYFNSYLLLKPDSKEYINEIESLIKDRGFKIVKRLLLNDFKNKALNLYSDKDKEYLDNIKRHLESISYLFGNKGMVYILDKDKSLEELYYDTLKLKNEIRNKYSFTHAYGGYIAKDNNISHINLVHSPDVISKIYDRDLNYLLNNDIEEVGEKVMKKIKKYRSYEI